MPDPRDSARKAKAAAAKKAAAKKAAAVAKAKSELQAARAAKKAAAKRVRHTDDDYETLLQDAEARAWSVLRDQGYFKCYCPCADRHYVGVKLTPSSSRSLINTRKQFERLPCWDNPATPAAPGKGQP